MIRSRRGSDRRRCGEALWDGGWTSPKSSLLRPRHGSRLTRSFGHSLGQDLGLHRSASDPPLDCRRQRNRTVPPFVHGARLLPHPRQFVRVRQALVDALVLDASALDLLGNGRVGVIRLDRSNPERPESRLQGFMEDFAIDSMYGFHIVSEPVGPSA